MDWLESSAAISRHALMDETTAVQDLLARVDPLRALDKLIRAHAAKLIASQRQHGAASMVEAFLQSYGLSSKEGIALLCLAEALLRIPDADTADQLIEDSFKSGNWKDYLGDSSWAMVNASSWGLVLTGSVLKLGQNDSPAAWLGQLVKKSGEPVIRNALRGAMKFLGNQFVMGEDIASAIKHAQGDEKKGYHISYDMLGEGARSDTQAQDYITAYAQAIAALAPAKGGALHERPSISVKLSALHPRYSATQEKRVFDELLPRMKIILRAAKKANIAVAFDAEEANRLDLSLRLYHAVLHDAEFAGFDGLGWVLQSYQKRAIYVAQALADMARSSGHRIPVRLVKGAYWDSEIKQAQIAGLEGYPVFTRKIYTDLSYLACAQELLGAPDAIYPQFATHNALTAATIIALAGEKEFEFQRLHGMGETLHDQLIANHRCRIYAPVGAHKDLLAYLIRRLLENGANSSFVHLLMDEHTPIDELTKSPIAQALAANAASHRDIPLPRDLYGPTRDNPIGIDFGYSELRKQHLAAVAAEYANYPTAPKDTPPSSVKTLLQNATTHHSAWQATPVEVRADILRRAAMLMEQRAPALLALCIREAKKTHADAIAELREAIDFLRYYANEAQRVMAPLSLPGPTGESNSLSLHGRGMFLCISPWNFPLSIFTGQVAAALVTGNSVIAKPAEQTPRIAAAATAILHEAGIPKQVLQLACGDGETLGAALVAAPAIAGVCFTGSTAVAQTINRALAAKDGPIATLIAETGGLNAMMVDSSALLEQAVDDIIASAFGSAGQRCSALRVLLVQEEIAEPLWSLLCGAMDELRTGDNRELATDVPPVIDAAAKKPLDDHIKTMKKTATRFHVAPEAYGEGDFVLPHLFQLKELRQLGGEQFGPILHFIAYKAAQREQTITAIHATGYGLTFGLQTRLRSTIDQVLAQVHAGNRYVNRSMIGAVVGVQPFGGEGMSGTGPKAGGPHYLPRFCVERTTTINTAAIGGNLELLS
jgi:RHH-type proline utilization regulon transcriptional repressor/proline dehydrogenase/delta 1-pyrroline-5-carboxylate dehydrogenase